MRCGSTADWSSCSSGSWRRSPTRRPRRCFSDCSEVSRSDPSGDGGETLGAKGEEQRIEPTHGGPVLQREAEALEYAHGRIVRRVGACPDLAHVQPLDAVLEDRPCELGRKALAPVRATEPIE